MISLYFHPIIYLFFYPELQDSSTVNPICTHSEFPIPPSSAYAAPSYPGFMTDLPFTFHSAYMYIH